MQGEPHAPKGGFDANLELPLADAYWASLFANCVITSTSNLDALTAALLDHRYDFSYLPSANCFFLRNDRSWRGLASALSPRTKAPAQSSVFVVKRSNPATSWQQLKGAKLGYINTYCTTSYFSPSILLARDGLALNDFFDAFAVAPWQGQIDAVVDGQIDATMVYEDVWLARPSNAAETRVIARLDDLPTPPVIALTGLDAAFTSKLTAALMAYEPKPAPGMLYTGFASYQDMRMRRFFAELEKVPGLARQARRRSSGVRVQDIVAIALVGARVFHHARHLADERLVVAGAAQEVEAHLHPRRDAARRHDAPGIDDARAADLGLGRDLGEPVDRHLAEVGGFEPVGLLAVGRRLAVEQAHGAVDPRAGADARQQRRLGE